MPDIIPSPYSSFKIKSNVAIFTKAGKLDSDEERTVAFNASSLEERIRNLENAGPPMDVTLERRALAQMKLAR